MYLEWRAGSQCDGVVVIVVSEHLAECIMSSLVGKGISRILARPNEADVRRCCW